MSRQGPGAWIQVFISWWRIFLWVKKAKTAHVPKGGSFFLKNCGQPEEVLKIESQVSEEMRPQSRATCAYPEAYS